MCGEIGEAAARLRPSERSEWLERFVSRVHANTPACDGYA